MDRADRQNSTSQISNLIKSKLNLTDLIKSKDLLRGRVAKEYSAGVLLQGYIDFFFLSFLFVERAMVEEEDGEVEGKSPPLSVRHRERLNGG